MTIPNVDGTFCVAAGLKNCVWLNTLNHSNRNCSLDCSPSGEIAKFLIAEKSQLFAPKPGCVFRARLPNCPRAGVE